jgi:hypothetical protein
MDGDVWWKIDRTPCDSREKNKKPGKITRLWGFLRPLLYPEESKMHMRK